MKRLLLLLVLLSQTGCSYWIHNMVYGRGRASPATRTTYIEKHPDLTEREREDIRTGYVWIGATAEQVRATLGKPRRISRDVGSWGVHEQWVFRGLYVYFEDGIVTSLSN